MNVALQDHVLHKEGRYLHNVLILLIKNSARSCQSGNQAKFTYLLI